MNLIARPAETRTGIGESQGNREQSMPFNHHCHTVSWSPYVAGIIQPEEEQSQDDAIREVLEYQAEQVIERGAEEKTAYVLAPSSGMTTRWNSVRSSIPNSTPSSSGPRWRRGMSSTERHRATTM